MKVTIDRIENGHAVLLVRDNETIQFDLPIILLPEGSREGDILEINITRDSESTDATKQHVSSLLEKLKNKNKRKQMRKRS